MVSVHSITTWMPAPSKVCFHFDFQQQIFFLKIPCHRRNPALKQEISAEFLINNRSVYVFYSFSFASGYAGYDGVGLDSKRDRWLEVQIAWRPRLITTHFGYGMWPLMDVKGMVGNQTFSDSDWCIAAMNQSQSGIQTKCLATEHTL